MKTLLTLVIVGIVNLSFTSDTLYIIKSQTSIGVNNTYLCTFNDSNVFSHENYAFQLNSGASLDVTVVNTDTSVHTFTIDGYLTSGNQIQPGDTMDFSINNLPDGTYRYYSDVPWGKNIGASGVVQVGYEQYDRYTWNLLDVDTASFAEIALGTMTNFDSDYLPSYFLINGKSFPATVTDSSTSIYQQLGDTIIISVINSGHMVNSFHFHGFHFDIIGATEHTDYIGWTKDSTPFVRKEAMTIMLVAYQEGMYPIHSHNLMAVTNSGLYPGGMITMINIQP